MKDKSKADLLREAGLKLTKSGSYLEAIQCFNCATRVSPIKVIPSEFLALNDMNRECIKA